MLMKMNDDFPNPFSLHLAYFSEVCYTVFENTIALIIYSKDDFLTRRI